MSLENDHNWRTPLQCDKTEGQRLRDAKEDQERKNEKENQKKKKMWLISKQYLQPLECPDELYPGAGASVDKSFRRAVDAAKYGMKEGLLTGAFFGGSWGIFKVFNDSFVVREGRRGISDGKEVKIVRSKRRDSSEYPSYPESSKKSSMRSPESDYSADKSHYNLKRDEKKDGDRKVTSVMKDSPHKKKADTQIINSGYTELLSRSGADPYDPSRFTYKKMGEKIEIVGYSFIKTTGSMTAKNSISDDDRSDDSDSQRGRATPSRDKDTGSSKNRANEPEVQTKNSNFKEKSSNITRLDVIEESRSTKTIKDNLASFKDRVLCKTASNKILHPRCFRPKENKAAKESPSPGKSKFDGFHIHRGIKNKTDTHKERRNEENVYPRFGHKFSYLVDVDLIGNGYLSDIEVNAKSKTHGRATAHSKKTAEEAKVIHPKSTFTKERIEDQSGYNLIDSQDSKPNYLGESDQSIQRESHTVIKRSIITELKKEKSNSTIFKNPRAQFGELHRQRSFSVTPEDGTSHYRDLNRKKSYTMGSEESTQISNHSYTIRTPSAKPSAMERGERTSVVPEDIIPLLDKIPKQRSYIITSEKGPPGGGISNQESIGYSETRTPEAYLPTPELLSLPVNDSSNKDKGPPFTPITAQESHYMYGKDKGPPRTPISAQDSHYVYGKDKGSTRAAVSAQDSQSGQGKDKGTPRTPVSAQDSQSGHGKDKGTSRTPVSTQESQSGHGKDKGPPRTPISAQDSQSGHGKDKGPPRTPISTQESQSGYSKDKGSPRTPVSTQESQSGYSKDKGPPRTPVSTLSAQESQYGYGKDKGPPFAPVSPRDSLTVYAKDKIPPRTPVSALSAQESQSGYSKDKGPPRTPVSTLSAQESQYGYGKDKGPTFPPVSPRDSLTVYAKDKAPSHTPVSALSAQESQYGYGKDKGPPRTPISAQESPSGYSKDKGPPRTPVSTLSAQESQYGYGKDKGPPPFTPVSPRDSLDVYAKDKASPRTPLSAQGSHYAYGKEEPPYRPVSAQDSQFIYSKIKTPSYTPNAQEGPYGRSETPKTYGPPPEGAKSKKTEAQKPLDREIVSVDPIVHTKAATKQKKVTPKTQEKHHASEPPRPKVATAGPSEKNKQKSYDLKAPDTISETNEIDQRSYVLSSEFGSYTRNERAQRERDFINSPTVVEPRPYRKASESTLEKEFKAIDKKFEPDSVSGYFETEREITHSPLEDARRGRSLEKNISNFLKAVFSTSQENTPSKKSIVTPNVKAEVTAARAEAPAVASASTTRGFQENMILFGACNCAIILGILCSVLSCTRAYLAG